MEDVSEQLVGLPIRAPWLNQLRTNQKVMINTYGAGPVVVSHQADGVQISLDKNPRRVWPGRVTSDAGAGYSDARYLVARQYVSNNDATALSDYTEFSDSVFPESDIVTATNLAEWDATGVFSDNTQSKHLLPYNTPVTVFEFKDESVPPQSRYTFYAEPALCLDDTYSPAGSDTIYLAPLTSDITGSSANSDHWSMTGHMYVDSDSQINPWVTIDPGVVGITFAVKVTQTGGIAGNSSDKCTFTYLVTDVKSDVVLGSTMAPAKSRPATGELEAPSDNSYGLGFYNASTFVLYDANETLQTSDCA